MLQLRRPLIALAIVAVAATAAAQDRPGRGGERAERQSEHNGPGVLALLPADAVTEHSIDTRSGKLDYTATAGTYSLFDQSGERSAAPGVTAPCRTRTGRCC